MPKKKSKKNNKENKIHKEKKNQKKHGNSTKNIHNNENASNYVLVKVKSENTLSVPDVIQNMEDYLFSQTGKCIKLKAINPHFIKKGIKFYVQTDKECFRILINNYKSMTKYSYTCTVSSDIREPEFIPNEWLEILEQCLESRYQFNPITNEAQLNLQNFVEDTILINNGIYINLSNNSKQKLIGELLKNKVTHLSVLDLSNNKMHQINGLKQFIGSIAIDNVNLSNNRINNVKELEIFKDSKVKSLDLTKNKFPNDFRSLKMSISPILSELTQLNNTKIEIVQLPKSNIVTQLPEIVSNKTNEFYNIGLLLCERLDRKVENEIKEMYSNESVLTFCNTLNNLKSIKSLNLNLLITKNIDKKISVNENNIYKTIMKLPDTRTIVNSVNVDFICTGNVMTLLITGISILKIQGSSAIFKPSYFSRSVIILTGENGLQKILHDNLNLLQYNSSNKEVDECIKKWRIENEDMIKNKRRQKEAEKEVENIAIHSSLKNMSESDRNILMQFKQFSGMTIEASIEFLKLYPDPQVAGLQFTNMKNNGEIPDAAFEK